jgi:transketolase
MTLRLADHCGRYLSELATMDSRICALDGDLADSDGAIHFAQTHPDRFIMAGIAEQSMVSLAAGMASCGQRPWVFSFGAFLCYRAYDQVRVCLSQSRQPVTLVGSHTGGCSARNGKTHASLNDIAVMASLPNVNVWSPADPEDLKFAMRNILSSDNPAYLRLPRRPLEEQLPGIPSLYRWSGKPTRVAMLSTGLGTYLALAAQAQLAQRGLDVGVLHCLLISPLPSGLVEELDQVETLFVIEDHYRFGGLASIIQHSGLQAKVVSLGWPPGWTAQSGSDEKLLEMHGLAPHQIADKIYETTWPEQMSESVRRVECSPSL